MCSIAFALDVEPVDKYIFTLSVHSVSFFLFLVLVCFALHGILYSFFFTLNISTYECIFEHWNYGFQFNAVERVVKSLFDSKLCKFYEFRLQNGKLYLLKFQWENDRKHASLFSICSVIFKCNFLHLQQMNGMRNFHLPIRHYSKKKRWNN